MSCENVKECRCPSVDCENHAQCCLCVVNHRGKDKLPFCLRPQPTDEKK
jgi:hypothetical protein